MFHFTPTSAPWFNTVESFLSAQTRRGVFHFFLDLQVAIRRFIAEHSDDPKPFIFVWTKPPLRPSAKRPSQSHVASE